MNIINNTVFDWEALKPTLPFSQLPFLEHGSVKIAQSNAILRYIAEIANLNGDTPAEYAFSEMLISVCWCIWNIILSLPYFFLLSIFIIIYVNVRFAYLILLMQEAEDIFQLIAKANGSSDKAAAYNELFAPNGKFAQQMAYVEKLHPGDGPFFNSKHRIAGGFAMAASLDIATRLEPTCLNAFPKLKAFLPAMLVCSILLNQFFKVFIALCTHILIPHTEL